MTNLDSRLGDNRRFSFQSEAYPQDSGKFAVVRMEGSEAISRPYRFELILVSDDAQIDLDLMLARSATFSLHSPGERPPPPNHYSGVLAEFDQLHQAGGYTFYRAVLVPRLWRLSLYRISEVYLHEQTIPGIIASVLKAGGLNSQDFQIQTQGDYRGRSFVCQYQETHLDFISRWMEKEGLYYYFSQDGKKETLQIVDSRFIHPAEAKTLHYRPVGEPDTGLDAQSVQSFIQQRKPMPAKLVLQDYNYRKADTELRVEVEVSPAGFGEVMIYGENFRDENEGKRYANIRKQELLCGERVFVGEATASGLCTGHFAELQAHYRQDFNARYLITQISHEGSQAGMLLAGLNTPYNVQQGSEAVIYQCSFKALPASTQFRPERSTPKPRIAGTMNATVDAEGSGEYAEMDEFGQYKVQIPFDYTDKAEAKASAHVRMASPYAGSDHGMHFPLIRGSEVLLSFTDGDPDQPTIVGSVPNSSNPSVANNQNHQQNVISTRGGNQVLMQDAEGKEVIWLNSPFHNSSIGIGSVHPDGDGSIYQATMGGNDKVTLGNSSEINFSASNSFGIGSDNSLKASVSNSGSIGVSTNISTGSSIKWTFDPAGSFTDKFALFKSYSIDDTDSIKFSPKFGGKSEKSFSFESVVKEDIKKNILDLKDKTISKSLISACFVANITAAAVYGNHIKPTKRKKKISDKLDKALEKTQKIDKAKADYASKQDALNRAILAANMNKDAEKAEELNTAVSTAKNAVIDSKEALDKAEIDNQLTDDEKKEIDAYNDKKTDDAKGDDWPHTIRRFGMQAGVNLAGQVIFQLVARKIAAKYEELSYANQIKADKDGISLSVSNEKSPSARIDLSHSGSISLHSENSPASGSGLCSALRLKGPNGVSEIISSKSLILSSDEIFISIEKDILTSYEIISSLENEKKNLISESKKIENKIANLEESIAKKPTPKTASEHTAAIASKAANELRIKHCSTEISMTENRVETMKKNKMRGIFTSNKSNSFLIRNHSTGLNLDKDSGEFYADKTIKIHLSKESSHQFSGKGLEVTRENLKLMHGTAGLEVNNNKLHLHIGGSSIQANQSQLKIGISGFLYLG